MLRGHMMPLLPNPSFILRMDKAKLSSLTITKLLLLVSGTKMYLSSYHSRRYRQIRLDKQEEIYQ